MKNSEVKYEIVKIANIGQLIINELLTEVSEGKRKTNGQIVAKVKEVFTNAKTTNACVAWYVSHLKDATFRAKHGVDEDRYEMMKSLKADKN